MKFENLYIECENLEQRDEVADFVKRSGYSYVDSAHEDSTVAIYDDGRFQYLGSCKFSPSISHQEFMQKYGKSEMKKSIEKAMAELKLNRHELSSALGMSRPYITKMLTCPQSEKTQARVVKMIDELMQSGGAKNIPIPDSAEKFLLKGIIDARDKTIKELNQALEYKDQLLAKNKDDLTKTLGENVKLEKICLHRTSECRDLKLEISLNAGLIQDLNNEIERLSKENVALKRESKDIQIHHAIVCVILILLVAWGFYV